MHLLLLHGRLPPARKLLGRVEERDGVVRTLGVTALIPEHFTNLQTVGIVGIGNVFEVVRTAHVIPTIPLMSVIGVVVIDRITLSSRIPNTEVVAVFVGLTAEERTAHGFGKLLVAAIDTGERDGDKVVLTGLKRARRVANDIGGFDAGREGRKARRSDA